MTDKEAMLVLMRSVCERTKNNPPDLPGELERLRNGGNGPDKEG